MKKLSLIIVITIAACIFILPVQLFAHKVNIYAYTGDGMVYSESYFADGSKCRNCTVEVFDKKTGKSLLEGKTDENGKFSFKIPSAFSLKLVLRAGTGHQGVYHLSEKDMGGAFSKDETPDITANQPKKSENIRPNTTEDKRSYAEAENGKCLSSAEAEVIINKAVEAKLEPVMRRLAMIQERTGKAGVAEIIGGIGYILGIMGIIMYLKGRKNAGK